MSKTVASSAAWSWAPRVCRSSCGGGGAALVAQDRQLQGDERGGGEQQVDDERAGQEALVAELVDRLEGRQRRTRGDGQGVHRRTPRGEHAAGEDRGEQQRPGQRQLRVEVGDVEAGGAERDQQRDRPARGGALLGPARREEEEQERDAADVGVDGVADDPPQLELVELAELDVGEAADQGDDGPGGGRGGEQADVGRGGAGRPAGLGPEPGVEDRHQDAAGDVGQRHVGGVEGVPAERGGRGEEQHHLREEVGDHLLAGSRPAVPDQGGPDERRREGRPHLGGGVGRRDLGERQDRPDQRDAGNHQHPALSQPGRLAAVEARRSVRDAHDFPLAASSVGASRRHPWALCGIGPDHPAAYDDPIPHERLSRCLRVRRIGLPPARAEAAVGAEAHPVRRRRAQLHREGLGRRGRALGADVPRRVRGGAAQPGRRRSSTRCSTSATGSSPSAPTRSGPTWSR